MTYQSSSPFTRKSDSLHYTCTKLTFRITGLKPHNLDRLKITLKVSTEDKTDIFLIDSLNLYNSRSRESFIVSCQKNLKIKPSTTAAEFAELIKILEKERIAVRERGTQGTIPPM